MSTVLVVKLVCVSDKHINIHVPPERFELPSSSSVAKRSIHWAMGAYLNLDILLKSLFNRGFEPLQTYLGSSILEAINEIIRPKKGWA